MLIDQGSLLPPKNQAVASFGKLQILLSEKINLPFLRSAFNGPDKVKLFVEIFYQEYEWWQSM